jgi:1-acyl-sn-glycerol-3-phosphate acyltransferase
VLSSLEQARARVEKLDLAFNSTGVDAYGVSKEHLAKAAVVCGKVYRHYFHTQCSGAHHVPTRGRAMLVANHSGGYAIDAFMLATACFYELEPPRLAHGMADRFIGQLPFLSEWATRIGQINGLPQHARRLLQDERLLMVFPEGTRGTAKLFRERHSLVRFGTGFVRLAMETKTPIIPTAVLGGGEAVPTVANLRKLGKLIGIPYIPITPYLVAFPLPVRMMIRFGEPVTFEGTGQEDDSHVMDKVEDVKHRILALIEEGKQQYKPL